MLRENSVDCKTALNDDATLIGRLKRTKRLERDRHSVEAFGKRG